MKILVVEDEPVSRSLLSAALRVKMVDYVAVGDGEAAWDILQQDFDIKLVLLDWVLPGIDGLEVCRRSRTLPGNLSPYIIMLTGNDRKEDVVQGLEAGADDYITKPFDRAELFARINVGLRMQSLQQSLNDRVKELEAALIQVNELQGLVPICAYCKKVRDDKNFWQQVETYVSDRSAARFSHGICPDCKSKMMEEIRRGALAK